MPLGHWWQNAVANRMDGIFEGVNTLLDRVNALLDRRKRVAGSRKRGARGRKLLAVESTVR
jgi:hypothetical protein